MDARRTYSLVMLFSVFVFAALTLFVMRTAQSADEFPSDTEIRKAIDLLTEGPTGHPMEVFYRNPARAAELLVTALKPIARGRYHQHPQAVWIIRSLRSLTGVDFQAPARAKLTQDESHFLGADSQRRVRFFGTWMSRDLVWVAPEDAQREIIRQWRDWCLRHCRSHVYVNERDFGKWYF